MPSYGQCVFINVPFDRSYKKLFRALIFAVHDCGLKSRTALEREDGGEVRIDKIYRLIEECQYGIHDLSRTTLDSVNKLPRFNMPLELGVFLGARHFGERRHRRKSVLILDRDQYRYQKFCSDISGQDIRAHHNKVEDAMFAVRNWLDQKMPSQLSLPGTGVLRNRYIDFSKQLPNMCREAQLSVSDLSYRNYCQLVEGWRTTNPL